MQHEVCFICSAATGRAGKGDDSLYDDDDEGPYCEDCWYELKEIIQENCVKQMMENK